MIPPGYNSKVYSGSIWPEKFDGDLKFFTKGPNYVIITFEAWIKKRDENVWSSGVSDLQSFQNERLDFQLSNDIYVDMLKCAQKKLWTFYDFDFFEHFRNLSVNHEFLMAT